MFFATPDEAEEQYYEAFAAANADMMAAVWLDEEHATCIHPLAERLRGFQAIVSSWRSIFDSQGPTPIEFTAVDRHQGPALAVHVGVEIVRSGRGSTALTVTNIYQLTNDGWRMLLHHASPQAASRGGGDERVH